MKLFELPKGWVWASLEECAEIILGQSPSSSTYNKNGNGLPFYQGKLEFGDTFPTPRKWCTAPKKIAEKRDVLISVRAPVGPTNLCIEKSCIGRGLAAVRGLNGIESLFILYLLRAFEDEIAGKGTGTTFNAITGGQLKKFAVPIPPLPEQHRIVTKIEELFTQLDAGGGALTNTKAQLKRYRQSVLKSACEGRLVPTEAELARAEGRDYEPADVLLARIGKERREKWGAEKTRKGKKSAKYKEPAAPDVSGLPELPEGWVWTTFDQVSDRVTVGHVGTMKNEYIKSGIPFLRSQNVRENRFDPNGLKFISREFHEKLSKSNLQPGDLVVVRSGSVGVSCVIPEALSEANCSDLVIVKQPQAILSHYGAFYMNSIAQSRINAKKVGVALIHFNTKSMAEMPVPLPPLAEQHRIVAEIERRLSVADEIEKTVDQSLKQAERLHQSILKRAFEGKLVSQNSNDEPASVLLKRIKEEKVRRDAEEKAKKKSKAKPKRKKMKVRKDAETEKQTVELYEILRLSKLPLTLKELWQSSKLEIEDFYDQLKIEVEKGRIIERRRSNSDVFMEIVI